MPLAWIPDRAGNPLHPLLEDRFSGLVPPSPQHPSTSKWVAVQCLLETSAGIVRDPASKTFLFRRTR
jgi:hypothetical protein